MSQITLEEQARRTFVVPAPPGTLLGCLSSDEENPEFYTLPAIGFAFELFALSSNKEMAESAFPRFHAPTVLTAEGSEDDRDNAIIYPDGRWVIPYCEGGDGGAAAAEKKLREWRAKRKPTA
jgi:hypothetical protein